MLAVAFHVVVLLLPLLLSRDVFSYAFYGRILSRYGQNPYNSTPADFPASDISRFVWDGWRDTPSVYGPVFVWLAAAITAVFRGLADVIEAFRAIAVAASLGSLWFVVRRRRTGPPGPPGLRRRDDRGQPGRPVPHGGRRPRRRARHAVGGCGHLPRGHRAGAERDRRAQRRRAGEDLGRGAARPA